MKYMIYNIKEEKFENDGFCFVSQSGKVILGDETLGWGEAECQENYAITLLEGTYKKSRVVIKAVGGRATMYNCDSIIINKKLMTIINHDSENKTIQLVPTDRVDFVP